MKCHHTMFCGDNQFVRPPQIIPPASDPSLGMTMTKIWSIDWQWFPFWHCSSTICVKLQVPGTCSHNADPHQYYMRGRSGHVFLTYYLVVVINSMGKSASQESMQTNLWPIMVSLKVILQEFWKNKCTVTHRISECGTTFYPILQRFESLSEVKKR